MASKSYKIPPLLTDKTHYQDWKKEVEVWEELTDLTNEKKALAVFASLEGKAKKTALQLEIKDLNGANGMNNTAKRNCQSYS